MASAFSDDHKSSEKIVLTNGHTKSNGIDSGVTTSADESETDVKEQFVYMPYNFKGSVEVHNTRESRPQHTCIEWRHPRRLVWPQDAELLHSELDTQGAAVVSLLSEAEATQHRDALFSSFAQHFGFDQNPTEWKMTKEKKPQSFDGIYQAYGCAHFPTMWQLRTDKRLRALYSHVYKHSDLLPSMDTFKLNMPHEYHPLNPDLRKSTLHLDVSLECARSPLRVFQGVINLSQQSPAAGGLFISLGSHKHRFKDDEFSSGWPRYLEPAKFPLPLVAWYLRPGDIVIFDSSCVHGTQKCLTHLMRKTTGTAENLRALSRVAAYVTYMPTAFGRRWGNESDTWDKRKKALEERRGTNHIVYHLQKDGIDFGKVKVTPTKPRGGRKNITSDARMTVDEIRELCRKRSCSGFIEEGASCADSSSSAENTKIDSCGGPNDTNNESKDNQSSVEETKQATVASSTAEDESEALYEPTAKRAKCD